MIRVEEKSLELAIVKASSQLGVIQSNLGFRVVKKHVGFLGIFGKKVCIEAWIKKSGAKSSSDSKPSIPSSQESNKLKEELRSFCINLCSRMVGEHVQVKAALIKERLVLDIANDHLEKQISKNIKIAESLEHILRKKPRYLRQELPFRVFVDANRVRLKREDDLIKMAKDLSNKVSENQRPIVLNYQSPYDRKVIHLALDKDSRVYTKSIGVGQNRKLMILPSKTGQSEANA